MWISKGKEVQTLDSDCNIYKKKKEPNLPTFILFDYENAYGNIQQIVNGDKILSRLLLVINNLYRNTTIKTRLEVRNVSESTHINKGGDKAAVCRQLFLSYA
jgi:hypothetical protein